MREWDRRRGDGEGRGERVQGRELKGDRDNESDYERDRQTDSDGTVSLNAAPRIPGKSACER